MADIGLGVAGVLGVALQTATAVHAFISNVKEAPRAIRTLASHIGTLRDFLESLSNVLQNETIRQRPQNVKFMPIVESGARQFSDILQDLNLEVQQYVKVKPGTKVATWVGWWTPRNFKYAFKKRNLVQLEASMLKQLEALHFMLRPMDLYVAPTPLYKPLTA
jgi:hypothetical protein